MICFLEVFALDVISELLSVIVSFVAQLAFQIFSRKSLQNVFKPGFLVCLAHIWDTNLLTQLLTLPGNANQSSPA